MGANMVLVMLASACVAALMIFLAWTTRSGMIRLVGLLVMAVSVGLTLAATLESAGRPRIAQIEFVKASKAAVLAAQGVEGTAIYLWLQLPEQLEPRYYVLPWSQELAQELKKAMEALKPGEQLMMDNPFERTWDRKERKFYPLPQPKLPEKPGNQQPDQGFSYKQHSI